MPTVEAGPPGPDQIDSLDLAPDRVRTFHGRHGRITDRMRSVVAELGPGRRLADRRDPDRPLVLEVGCGFGEAAMGFAAAHPDVDLLAVDVHTPGVVALLEAAAESRTPNLFVERADGLHVLDRRLGKRALAGVHLFFPDPWPKVRHHKRRFVRPDVVDLLADRLVTGGALRVATDVADYAAGAERLLSGHPAFEGGPAGRPEWRPRTRYEGAAIAAGRVVTDLVHRRR